ncbi:unnamed protein product [Penicillium viridicatum]
MSTTTSTTSASPTSTACGGSVWEIPTTDAACAAVISGNITDVMDDCCKDAKVSKYDNDCGIYCLAQGQDVNKLQSCLTSKSGNYNNVFCNAALNATATATATGSKSTSSGTGTSTQSSATSTSTNAAIANQPISKSGVGLIALLFGSALMARTSDRATVFSYLASVQHNIFLMHTHDLICTMDSPYYNGRLLYSRE